jgi:DNA-binding NarL/FixJ family response regulator
MNALASHWRYVDLVEALLEDTPQLAAPAVLAAGERAADDVLVRFLSATRGVSGGDLARAVEMVLARRPGVMFEPRPVLPELTKRERQVLCLMAKGRRNAEISEELFLSPLTVKTHVNHIFRKLGVHNRVRAVLAFKDATGNSIDAP